MKGCLFTYTQPSRNILRYGRRRLRATRNRSNEIGDIIGSSRQKDNI